MYNSGMKDIFSDSDHWVKIDLYPNGYHCKECDGKHFHPKATILPNLYAEGTVHGKQVKLWVARSECLDCDSHLDWTFNPDLPNGYGEEYNSILYWNESQPDAFKEFPRSKK